MADSVQNRSRRGFASVGDMLRSLGLVVAAVAVLMLITLRPQGDAVRTVDYRSVLQEARLGAPYALADPVGLPAGWRPTSVYFDPPVRTGAAGVTDWHIGFVTPSDRYAAVEQTSGPAARMLGQVLDDPAPAPTAAAGASGWQRWTDRASDRRALVRTTGAVTVVIDGTAGWTELERLASSLRLQAPLRP